MNLKNFWQIQKKFLNERVLRNKITDVLGPFLFKKTERHPMILPVILGVTEADAIEINKLRGVP